MEVTGTSTREDLIHYYRTVVTHQRPFQAGVAFWPGIAVGVMGMISIAQTFGLTVLYVAAGVLAACAVIQMLWMRSDKRLGQLVDTEAQINPSLYISHTVTLDPEWICTTSMYHHIRLRWQAVRSVKSDTDYIFIRGGGIINIIRCRDFSTPEDAERFYAMANTYWQTAKQRPLQEEGVWPPAPRTLN